MRSDGVWTGIVRVAGSFRSFCSRVSFFKCFFRVFKMFLVGLATDVRLCFMSDIVLLID